MTVNPFCVTIPKAERLALKEKITEHMMCISFLSTALIICVLMLKISEHCGSTYLRNVGQFEAECWSLQRTLHRTDHVQYYRNLVSDSYSLSLNMSGFHQIRHMSKNLINTSSTKFHKILLTSSLLFHAYGAMEHKRETDHLKDRQMNGKQI
jgi:hypothetical protein